MLKLFEELINITALPFVTQQRFKRH